MACAPGRTTEAPPASVEPCRELGARPGRANRRCCTRRPRRVTRRCLLLASSASASVPTTSRPLGGDAVGTAYRRAPDAKLGRARFAASSLWFHDEEREIRTRPNLKPWPRPGVESRLRAARAARELRCNRREMRGESTLPVVRTSGSWRPARFSRFREHVGARARPESQPGGGRSRSPRIVGGTAKKADELT